MLDLRLLPVFFQTLSAFLLNSRVSNDVTLLIQKTLNNDFLSVPDIYYSTLTLSSYARPSHAESKQESWYAMASLLIGCINDEMAKTSVQKRAVARPYPNSCESTPYKLTL